MGKINKYANLYDLSGKKIKSAPIEAEALYKKLPPISHKYPGGILPYAYHYANNNN